MKEKKLRKDFEEDFPNSWRNQKIFIPEEQKSWLDKQEEKLKKDINQQFINMNMTGTPTNIQK